MFNILQFLFSSKPLEFVPKTDSLPQTDKQISALVNLTFAQLFKTVADRAFDACQIVGPQASSKEIAIYKPQEQRSYAEMLQKGIAALFNRAKPRDQLPALLQEPTSRFERFIATWNEKITANPQTPLLIDGPRKSVSLDPNRMQALKPGMDIAERREGIGSVYNLWHYFQAPSHLKAEPSTTSHVKADQTCSAPSFYQGPLRSQAVFEKAFNTASNVTQRPMADPGSFYQGPLKSQAAFQKAFTEASSEVFNHSSCPVRDDVYKAIGKSGLEKDPQTAYGRYVAFGLLTLGACYYLYKKYTGKDEAAKSLEQEKFQSFKKEIELAVAAHSAPLEAAKQATTLDVVSQKAKNIEEPLSIAPSSKKIELSLFKKIFIFFLSLARVMKSVFHLEHPYLSNSIKHMP